MYVLCRQMQLVKFMQGHLLYQILHTTYLVRLSKLYLSVKGSSFKDALLQIMVGRGDVIKRSLLILKKFVGWMRMMMMIMRMDAQASSHVLHSILN